MNQIARNLNVESLIQALRSMGCKYVDAMVEGELTLVFKPSEWQDEEEEETDINDTII